MAALGAAGVAGGADAGKAAAQLEAEGLHPSVVILDPPAFTKSRNSVKNAVKGYRESSRNTRVQSE